MDDYGGVNYEVNTFIFYLRKDKTVRGGNLLIKDKKNHIIEEKKIIIKQNTII